MATEALVAKSTDVPAPADAASDDARATPAAWFMVCILSLTGVLAFADRIALSLVVQPLKNDLGVSDLQISLLLGFAFSVLYSLSAIPAGHLADLFSRRRIVIGAVAIWSVMAAVCGLSTNYLQLFLGRMGLGIGEGASSPAAVSMIRDAFGRAQRGKAFAIFHATPLIGGGGALFLGGVIFAAADAGRFAGIPLIGALKGWQIVLIGHALLGVPVLAMLFLMREPPRRSATAGIKSPSFADALRYVSANARYFVPLWIGVALLMSAQGGVSGWLPTIVHRAYGIPIPLVGKLLGPIQMLVVPIGSFIVGAIIDSVSRRIGGAGPALVTGICAAITAVVVAAQAFVHTLGLAAILYSIQVVLFGSVPMSISLVVSQVAPSRLVGKLVAVSGVFSMLLGFSWGPTAISLMAHLFSGPRALLDGLIAYWVVALPLGAACYGLLAARLHRISTETF